MEYAVLIIEPDLLQGKKVVHTLVQAGYDAIIASGADEALRQLYQVRPDAVIFSSRLSTDDLDQLSDRITLMCDLPLIGLGSDTFPISVTQHLAHSTTLQELPNVLNRLLEFDLSTAPGKEVLIST